MASKDCKFKSFFQCYGHFLLQNRFGVDQLPLELNRRDFTLEERETTDPEHIRGPKKDLDKRQASIQVPTLIFRTQPILLRIATRCRQAWSIERFISMVIQVRTLHFTMNASMLCGKKRHEQMNLFLCNTFKIFINR